MTTPSHAQPRPTVPAEDPNAATHAAGDEAASARVGREVAELEDRWRRALAEADNVRKRLERQIVDQVRAERARTAAAFLPVLDNLELALRHAKADPVSIVVGVEAVREQAVDVLRALGYQRIEPVGERFDPARHEAARVVEADGVEPGTVTDVLRPGYVDAEGTPVRPAVVAVASVPE
jgi:molecular chaperone GrpE